MKHHIYYGTNKFEFCNVKRETQDIGQCYSLLSITIFISNTIFCIFDKFFLKKWLILKKLCIFAL